MTWAEISRIAENPDKKWFLNQNGVAELLGYSRQRTAAFLKAQSVPHYRIGKEKTYFIPEVMEAVDKTKWA